MALAPHEHTLLTETHANSVATKALLEMQIKEISEIKARTTALEHKWWTIHGAWIAVSGALFFFKDKLAGLFS